jgi:prepilin signal peptidase PulO-like enzyme (type II secretory pathway)
VLIFIVILGYLAGIIINLLADSLPRSRKVERPACLECGAPRRSLAWSGLAAYASGTQACEYCAVSVGYRPAIVEAAAIIWPLVLYSIDPSPLFFWPTFLLSMYFLLVIVIDYEHRLILFVVTIPAAIVLAVLGSLDPSRGPEKTLLGGLVGFLAVFGLYLLGGLFARLVWRLRNQPIEEVAFGFGDVVLAGVIGLAVGYPGIVLALILGVLAGGIFSLGFIVVMVLRRRYEAFVPIPYSPFLILGGMVVYIAGSTGWAQSLVS